MPKIRKKQSLYIDGDFIKKSGILTRSIKNIYNKNTNSKSYFKVFNFHNTKKAEKFLIPYNDEDTIDFLVKNVNPTLSVEDVYKSKTKVLHTPNEFNTDYKQNILLTKSKYNTLLEETFLDENIDFKDFSENSFITANDLLQGKERIDVQLEFSSPLSLTNTLKTAYYDFKDKKWDYLDNTSNQLPIFNSISVAQNKTPIKNQSLGYPLTNDGFPLKSTFKGLNRHTLKMKNYTTKPFYLEEIKIRIKASHDANSPSHQREILNSLNFFVINQRKNLNQQAVINLGIESQFSDNTYKYLSNGQTVSYQNTGEFIEVYSDASESSEQRELVSYLTLVNYNSRSISSNNITIDYNSVKNNADYFYEDTIDLDDLVYEDKIIDIAGDVRTCISHDKLESMYDFKGNLIYPECKYTTRSGGELNTERSLLSDFTKPIDPATTSDDFGEILSISSTNFKENPYEINPADELLFGFSFEQSHELDDNVNPNVDLNHYTMTIKDKIEVSLIGRYYINQKPERIYYKNYNLKSQKRYLDQIVDNSGMSNIYLNKGAFFDKNFRWILDFSDELEALGAVDLEEVIENYESAAYGFGSSTSSGLLLPLNSKVFNRYQKVYLEEKVIRETNENLPEVNFSIIYDNGSSTGIERYIISGKGFGQGAITFSLDKDKKYIFDTSDSSMLGRRILTSKNNQTFLAAFREIYGITANEFISNGIIFNGTPGTSGSNITIIPEKFIEEKPFFLYLYDPDFDDSSLETQAQPAIFMTHDPNSYKRNHLNYDLLNFGMPIHKVYESKTLPFLDLVTNVKNYLVTKKFKNVLLEDLDNPSLTYNTDIHARKLDNKYNDNNLEASQGLNS